MNYKVCYVLQFSVAVVLVFFVCWTPFHAQRLMFVIVTLQGEWNPTNTMTHHYLYLFSGKYMIYLCKFQIVLKSELIQTKSRHFFQFYCTVICAKAFICIYILTTLATTKAKEN